jgi:hypothetical protein
MYVLNGATGEVHEGSCPRLGRMHAANLVPWDPDKAHLALGARACTECLTEVPGVARPEPGSLYALAEDLIRLVRADHDDPRDAVVRRLRQHLLSKGH